VRHIFQRVTTKIAQLWLEDARGSQIVEFAVALPLITVFVVGIFDFGSAFGLKQRMTNAVREGARVGANQPTADLSQTRPASVDAIAQVVGNSLVAAKVSDCGILSAAPTTSGALTWVYTGTTCAAGNVVLTINRGATFTVALPAPYSQNLVVEATQATLAYPYKWQFGNVMKVLVPSSSYAGTTVLNTSSIMQNMN
jgi:Flp pilus assembly protein TadG